MFCIVKYDLALVKAYSSGESRYKSLANRFDKSVKDIIRNCKQSFDHERL